MQFYQNAVNIIKGQKYYIINTENLINVTLKQQPKGSINTPICLQYINNSK